MSGSHDTAHHDRPLTGGRIHLAREPAIRLGALVIEPALRRVAHDDGREEIVEPRVMQVLVALVRASGGIVTRDDLLATCWHGVVVGEDAITRVMSRLRRLAEGIGGGQFELKTVTKVGYRLLSQEPTREDTTSVSAVTIGAPARATAGEPLLAVLAFENLCDGADMAWFSDGVSEEIQQTIARAADLRVIGRASSFQFRGTDKAAAKVALALNATHVLDGSVRRNGSIVRISAELIECAGQMTLWSDRFDRDLTDILAVQDEIAQAVAAALKRTLVRGTPGGKIDPAAYDLYLRARQPPEEDHLPHRDAIGLLERVVSLAPGFAPAWGDLALTRALVHRGVALVKEAPPRAVARSEVVIAAETALRLGPDSGVAHAALACLLPWGQYGQRETLMERALAADPNSPRTTTEMGWFLASVGRMEDSLRCASRSLGLDPLYRGAANVYGQALASTGRFDECLQAYATFRRKWPSMAVFLFAPLQLAAMRGDWQAYDVMRDQTEPLWASDPYIREALAVGTMLRDPTPRRRERILGVLRDQVNQTGTVQFGPVVLAHRMGLKDEAFSFVEKASFAHMFDDAGPAPGGSYSPGMIFDRSYNVAMMEDIRFVGFCAKIGLCDYWARTQRWPDCAEPGALPYDFKAEARRLAVA